VPDVGTSGSFVMTAGTQTISGAKTFSANTTFTGKVVSDLSSNTLDAIYVNDSSNNARIQIGTDGSHGVISAQRTVYILGDNDNNSSSDDILAVGTDNTDPSSASIFFKISQSGVLTMPASSAATIASGAVTRTSTHMVVDTEAAAATDDLDTINGGNDGEFLILRTANNARDVTCKDATGNLLLNGDFTLSNVRDSIMLIYVDSIGWIELSRSDNSP